MHFGWIIQFFEKYEFSIFFKKKRLFCSKLLIFAKNQQNGHARGRNSENTNSLKMR